MSFVPVSPTNVDPLISSVRSHFKKLPSEIEMMTYDEVLDANEVIWVEVENQYEAMEAAKQESGVK